MSYEEVPGHKITRSKVTDNRDLLKWLLRSVSIRVTTLNKHPRTISFNDIIEVLEDQHKNKQGIVKQIYRGTIF